jgi:phage-related protein
MIDGGKKYKIVLDDSVEEFITSLEKQTIAKVLRVIDLLERFQEKLNMPHGKKIADDIFELRIRGRQEIRIFYVFHKDVIVLLHGFVKKSNKIPAKEIEIAISRRKRLTLT